jgi:LPXTG-motif cell wall-anchored protein
VLRELHGNPHVGDHLLSAASSALLARADELALAIYRKALADPVLNRRMYREESLWAAFLPAVNSAIRVGRFDEAEAVLLEVERLAAEPVPLAAPLRVRIKLAREGARDAAERARAPTPPDPEPEAPRPPPELLPPAVSPSGLRPGGPEPAPTRVAPSGADGDGASDSVGWPVFAAFGALLALAALLLLRRRR